MMSNEEKLRALKDKLAYYEDKLAFKMKRYRGVIHESAASEMKHQEVMVIRAMVDGLKEEIRSLELLLSSPEVTNNRKSDKG